MPIKDHNSYLGSRYTDQDIQDSIKSLGLIARHSENIFSITASKLKEGKIVGWFQGASEFGPRALGNRSILCKPYPAEMKDYLNNRVKFREEFRPFAPSVMLEHVKKYFQINQESPHMLIACQVVKEMEEAVSAIVHLVMICATDAGGVRNIVPIAKERVCCSPFMSDKTSS